MDYFFPSNKYNKEIKMQEANRWQELLKKKKKFPCIVNMHQHTDYIQKSILNLPKTSTNKIKKIKQLIQNVHSDTNNRSNSSFLKGLQNVASTQRQSYFNALQGKESYPQKNGVQVKLNSLVNQIQNTRLVEIRRQSKNLFQPQNVQKLFPGKCIERLQTTQNHPNKYKDSYENKRPLIRIRYMLKRKQNGNRFNSNNHLYLNEDQANCFQQSNTERQTWYEQRNNSHSQVKSSDVYYNQIIQNKLMNVEQQIRERESKKSFENEKFILGRTQETNIDMRVCTDDQSPFTSRLYAQISNNNAFNFQGISQDDSFQYSIGSTKILTPRLSPKLNQEANSQLSPQRNSLMLMQNQFNFNFEQNDQLLDNNQLYSNSKGRNLESNLKLNKNEEAEIDSKSGEKLFQKGRKINKKCLMNLQTLSIEKNQQDQQELLANNYPQIVLKETLFDQKQNFTQQNEEILQYLSYQSENTEKNIDSTRQKQKQEGLRQRNQIKNTQVYPIRRTLKNQKPTQPVQIKAKIRMEDQLNITEEE